MSLAELEAADHALLELRNEKSQLEEALNDVNVRLRAARVHRDALIPAGQAELDEAYASLVDAGEQPDLADFTYVPGV